jgi:hypothetical protein
MKIRAVIVSVALIFWAPLTFADEDIGIFETILKSSVSFSATNEALQQAISESDLELWATRDVRVPESEHQARFYVLTSPAYARAAADESPRTVSAQILRVAVFTTGDEQKTVVNMANPVAHAMIFYADSARYDVLIGAASAAAEAIRQLVASVPGTPVSIQLAPLRTEKKYRKFNGDGPAKMMAKFRSWSESQLTIMEAPAGEFDAVVEEVVSRLAATPVSDAEDPDGWELVSQVRLRDDAVYLGLTNPFIEDRMIRINSRFRNDGKSEGSPYPGVDHVAALPTEVLVVKEGGKTLVLHYGQMWRMQLYFWDSGYRAFTANVGVPGAIVDSIEGAVQADQQGMR